MRYDYDLNHLRRDVAPLFRKYDEAVERRDSDAAYEAKMDITRRGISSLRDALPLSDARGLYFFAGDADCLSGLSYIGMSSPGTLAVRITTRLRSETCLDASQYQRSREDVWDTAYGRMCVSMGLPRRDRRCGSAQETLIKYAFGHMKATALFKSAARILFFVSDEESHAVKAAESLLIYSAVSAGAPLLNIQERDALVTEFEPGAELAMDVIQQARISASHWIERASAILGRFRGECCLG